MIPLCNLHTHTTYCDGDNTVEEMIASAIEMGCKTLGFSGHSPRAHAGGWCMAEEDVKKYIEDVKSTREKYADKIEVALGIEYDTHTVLDVSEFEYVIGSVHAIKTGDTLFDVDNGNKQKTADIVKEFYGGDWFEYAKGYYRELCRIPDVVDCQIIGHFDLLTKVNQDYCLFDEDDPRYRRAALEALEYLCSKDYIFEINTGAISRGYRREPYPNSFILKEMAYRGARIMLNSDTHSKNTILFHFEQAVEYARSCGVKALTVMENKKFREIGI